MRAIRLRRRRERHGRYIRFSNGCCRAVAAVSRDPYMVVLSRTTARQRREAGCFHPSDLDAERPSPTSATTRVSRTSRQPSHCIPTHCTRTRPCRICPATLCSFRWSERSSSGSSRHTLHARDAPSTSRMAGGIRQSARARCSSQKRNRSKKSSSCHRWSR